METQGLKLGHWISHLTFQAPRERGPVSVPTAEGVKFVLREQCLLNTLLLSVPPHTWGTAKRPPLGRLQGPAPPLTTSRNRNLNPFFKVASVQGSIEV